MIPYKIGATVKKRGIVLLKPTALNNCEFIYI
jgi:hypothetical protein